MGDRGGELLAGRLRPLQARLEGVAEGHEFGDLREDPALLGVAEGLPDPVGGPEALLLGLDDRERDVAPLEEVVGPRALAAMAHPTPEREPWSSTTGILVT